MLLTRTVAYYAGPRQFLGATPPPKKRTTSHGRSDCLILFLVAWNGGTLSQCDFPVFKYPSCMICLSQGSL